MKVAIRSQICAPPGKCLIELDLSAAESWVVAHLTNDQNMIHYLAAGQLHEFSASGIYQKADFSTITKPERYIGKKMNHSCGYRAGPDKVTEFINKEGAMVVSLAQVKMWWNRWHSTFNMKYWWNEIDTKLYRDGTITTAYGKRRKFWGFVNDETKKAATAFEPQSVVSYHMDGAIHPDLGIPGGLLEIQKQITLPSNGEIKMINTSHDSVLLEAPISSSLEIALHAASLLERPLIVNGHTFTIPVDCERFPRRWKEDTEHLNRNRGEFESKKAS